MVDDGENLTPGVVVVVQVHPYTDGDGYVVDSLTLDGDTDASVTVPPSSGTGGTSTDMSHARPAETPA